MPPTIDINDSEWFQNIQTIFTQQRTQKMFTLIVNNQHSFSIPIEVIVSLSRVISKELSHDFSLEKMNINIDFEEEENVSILQSIFNGVPFASNTSNNEKLQNDLLSIGLAIGNSHLFQPTIDFLNENNNFEAMSISTILDRLRKKQIISSYNQQLITFDAEITFLSKHFYNFAEEERFISWCQKENNSDFVEQIISHPNLLLRNEDQLFNFILILCERNKKNQILFKYLFLECCNESSINKLTNYINENNPEFNAYQLSLIICLLRRCCTYKPNLYQSFHKNRHHIKYYSKDDNGNAIIQLHKATKEGYLNIVSSLIEEGVEDINAKDKDGRTALHFACINGNIDIVKYLHEHRADINAKDNWEFTPLHWATEKGHFNIVKYLIEQNCDIHAKDLIGKTALNLATEKQQSNIISYLEQHGCQKSTNIKNENLIDASANGHLNIVTYSLNMDVISMKKMNMEEQHYT